MNRAGKVERKSIDKARAGSSRSDEIRVDAPSPKLLQVSFTHGRASFFDIAPACHYIALLTSNYIK